MKQVPDDMFDAFMELYKRANELVALSLDEVVIHPQTPAVMNLMDASYELDNGTFLTEDELRIYLIKHGLIID